MYARGGTGSGIEVAVFDTGGSFTHSDLASSYTSDRYFIPALGDANDGYNHGTHVAGIIAAQKNDVGMHGLAPDAKLVSYKIFSDSGSSYAITDSTLADAVNQMIADNVMIINNSWSTSASVTLFTKAGINASNPNSVQAYRNFDNGGGVQVFAAGNSANSEPDMEAGLPYLFSGLTSGWLAVMSVDNTGSRASYSNACGVAAAWCLAAPGGGTTTSTAIYSTSNSGGYTYMAGTSMATPHVSAALAALKSMFPSLTYQEIRTRLLTTTDSSGIYASSTIYGQGLMDLASASAPIGTTSIAVGATTSGAVIDTGATQVVLPQGAQQLLASAGDILVLDSFQRASFYVPIASFSRSSSSYVSQADLALSGAVTAVDTTSSPSLSYSGNGYSVGKNQAGGLSVSVGYGRDVLNGFSQSETVAGPQSNYHMAGNTVGVSVGMKLGKSSTMVASFASGQMADGEIGTGYGIAAWQPKNVASLSMQSADGKSAIGLSLASGLQSPVGWAGQGALGLSGQSVSIGYTRKIPLAPSAALEFSGRLAHLSAEQSALVSMNNTLVGAASAKLSVRLSGKTTLQASFSTEAPLHDSALQLQAGSSVNSNGQISFRSISLDTSGMLKNNKLSLVLEHQFSENATLGGGAALVRDGYGHVETIAGIAFKIRF